MVMMVSMMYNINIILYKIYYGQVGGKNEVLL